MNILSVSLTKNTAKLILSIANFHSSIAENKLIWYNYPKKLELTEGVELMCIECYADESRITPILNPSDCLSNHTQYICGTCGRCICIDHDKKRGLARWNFPFKSSEIAKLYLRTADYSVKKPCGIYKLKDKNGRPSYKIFTDNDDLQIYLAKNKEKICEDTEPVFTVGEYKEYKNTQVRNLTSDEIEKYMSER